MTDNHKKGKNSKVKGKGKKVPNAIKNKNDTNDLHNESEEEFENYENKKVKTEVNSDSKIVIPTPFNYNITFLQESLDLLRRCASDNDIFEDTQETINKLRVILDYKYRSQKVVFTKDIFERKLKNAITPAIFTRKNMQIRLSKPKTPMHLAFENYLNLVSQLYYKATHQLHDIHATIQAHELFKPTEEEKPIIQIDKPKRPGRKAKPKPQPLVIPEPTANNDQNGKTSGLNATEEGEKTLVNEESKNPADSMVLSCNDVLDSLVSPLRADYVFEKWNPKEVAIFEAGLCKYGKEFSFLQFLDNFKDQI